MNGILIHLPAPLTCFPNKNVNTSIKMDAIKINLANLENWPGSFLCMKNIAINPNET
jgi:hypothetical protein